jgi:ABC-type multidrug transport system fused ATPase/permease subunit
MISRMPALHESPSLPAPFTLDGSLTAKLTASEFAEPNVGAGRIASARVGGNRYLDARRQAMLAYDYPLLGIFWTMLWFFLFFIWIWILITIFADIFRSHDLGGFAKALWVIFVIVVPFLGVLIYLIARGKSMQERAVQRAAQQEQEYRGYVQDAAGSSGTADHLAKLADLKDQGVLTDAEFQAEKAKILSA